MPLDHMETMEGVATPQECVELITATQELLALDESLGGTDPAIHRHGPNTTVYPELFTQDPGIYGLLVERVEAELRRVYGRDLRSDCGLVVRLEEGGSHPLHADAELAGGQPNHTAHRKATGLLYLTWGGGADFAGGELIVGDSAPQTPHCGMLVVMPCTWAYRHQVLPVTEGERWSLNVWMQ